MISINPIKSCYDLEADKQYGDLYLPHGAGPFPVVCVIHGGWWKDNQTCDSYPTIHLVDHVFSHGTHAVWNLEFRRMEAEGANTQAPWPATLSDVARGIDHLRNLSGSHPLDLSQLCILGHSAGGHLTAWAASRRQLAPESPLYRTDPLCPRHIGLIAGIYDLSLEQSLEQPQQVTRFLGAPIRDVPDRHAQSCPVSLGLNADVTGFVLHGDTDLAVGATQMEALCQRHPLQLSAELCSGGHFAMLPDADNPAPHWSRLKELVDQMLSFTQSDPPRCDRPVG